MEHQRAFGLRSLKLFQYLGSLSHQSGQRVNQSSGRLGKFPLLLILNAVMVMLEIHVRNCHVRNADTLILCLSLAIVFRIRGTANPCPATFI